MEQLSDQRMETIGLQASPYEHLSLVTHSCASAPTVKHTGHECACAADVWVMKACTRAQGREEATTWRQRNRRSRDAGSRVSSASALVATYRD